MRLKCRIKLSTSSLYFKRMKIVVTEILKSLTMDFCFQVFYSVVMAHNLKLVFLLYHKSLQVSFCLIKKFMSLCYTTNINVCSHIMNVSVKSILLSNRHAFCHLKTENLYIKSLHPLFPCFAQPPQKGQSDLLNFNGTVQSWSLGTY